jgi:hypothetical protein
MFKTMNNNIFVPIIFIFASCTFNKTKVDPNLTIKNQIAQGRINSKTSFKVSKAFFKKENLFGKLEYTVYLFEAYDAKCIKFMQAPVSFTIPLIKTGNYVGNGPFFYESGAELSTSFNSANVIINRTSANEIAGQIKGGDIKSGTYIEGNFVATFCGQ